MSTKHDINACEYLHCERCLACIEFGDATFDERNECVYCPECAEALAVAFHNTQEVSA